MLKSKLRNILYLQFIECSADILLHFYVHKNHTQIDRDREREREREREDKYINYPKTDRYDCIR